YKPTLEQVGPLESPACVPGSRGQVSNAADNFVVAPWNRIDVLERILRNKGDQVAAIVMEPVLCNSGCILPRPGYLERVKELCGEYGALLMFDEVITGFRMSTGGAQRHYGVIPDLATYGKAVAGGAPLSGIAGRRDILMQMYTGVSFGGSFNGNPVSLACAQATLAELARNDGDALTRANEYGRRLMDGIREIAGRRGIPVMVAGFGAALAIHFTEKKELVDYRDTLHGDSARLQRFLFRALQEGLHIVPDGRMYVSAAHTARDIEDTLGRLDSVFRDLRISHEITVPV
ncbi:MAG: aminotransferase class III-fold pyridoxal phosphate-dependent enzyme, partial [Acidobacteriota bacterium]|nr:aminotransferase class III-fold pyridoxal phosphate-dependent enzyme [Acidobacteriota bacterium]